MRDEDGNIVMKKGKPIADTSLRDFENIPLSDDIDEYFHNEIAPFIPDAWIDYKKTKVGYEIPMNRFFYKYMIPEETESILSRLNKLEADITASLKDLFGEEVK